jgi:hypothetical protein
MITIHFIYQFKKLIFNSTIENIPYLSPNQSISIDSRDYDWLKIFVFISDTKADLFAFTKKKAL